jgi:hypothetical protein
LLGIFLRECTIRYFVECRELAGRFRAASDSCAREGVGLWPVPVPVSDNVGCSGEAPGLKLVQPRDNGLKNQMLGSGGKRVEPEVTVKVVTVLRHGPCRELRGKRSELTYSFRIYGTGR